MGKGRRSESVSDLTLISHPVFRAFETPPGRYQRYLPVDHIRVADNGSNLRVAIPSLGSFVDVRASNNREAIINNTNLSKMNIMTEIKPLMSYLGMDIDLLCGQYVTL